MRRGEQLRPEEHRRDIAEAFFHYLGVARSATDRLLGFERAAAVEQTRAATVVAEDAAYRQEDEARRRARAEVDDGVYFNLEESVVPPTPELVSKGDFVPYTPRGEDGTVRTVKTVRRLLITQIKYLHARGTIDDDLYGACRWYKDRYEAAELEPISAVSSYGETVRGDPAYGHLARTEWGAMARSDFRWARTFISADIIQIFDLVVLGDIGVREAARQCRCRFANATAAFRQGALELHGGIANRLQIEAAVGKALRMVNEDD